MSDEIMFTEAQNVVGYIETHSGSIVMADGIVESDIALSPKAIVSLDLKLDRKRIPVVATIQGGRRYLLIPLDLAEDIPNPSPDTVDTEDPVEVPKEKKEDESPE